MTPVPASDVVTSSVGEVAIVMLPLVTPDAILAKISYVPGLAPCRSRVPMPPQSVCNDVPPADWYHVGPRITESGVDINRMRLGVPNEKSVSLRDGTVSESHTLALCCNAAWSYTSIASIAT